MVSVRAKCGDFKELLLPLLKPAQFRFWVLPDGDCLFGELSPLLNPRQRAVRKYEIPIQQQRCSLKPGDAVGQAANSASLPEEVIEEGSLDPILVDEQKQFIEMGAVEWCAVIAKDGGEAFSIDLILSLYLRTRKQLDLPDEFFWFQYFARVSGENIS